MTVAYTDGIAKKTSYYYFRVFNPKWNRADHGSLRTTNKTCNAKLFGEYLTKPYKPPVAVWLKKRERQEQTKEGMLRADHVNLHRHWYWVHGFRVSGRMVRQ
jgi:hypothetical protein